MIEILTNDFPELKTKEFISLISDKCLYKILKNNNCDLHCDSDVDFKTKKYDCNNYFLEGHCKKNHLVIRKAMLFGTNKFKIIKIKN